ncbi:MAG: hypothetical protein LBF15_03005 [Candidatus Peribacteria bacterium]|nr:hypothetical protein [Candidatus Peribacteria bacterium]
MAYKFVIYIFNKFQIIKLIDRLFISMRKKELELEKADSGGVNVTKTSDKNKRIRIGKISDQIKIDDITAKSLAYYLFLIFFRWAVVFI